MSVLRLDEHTRLGEGRGAAAGALSSAGSPQHRPRLLIHTDPSPGTPAVGAGAALHFTDHSPAMTLGEASHCPVAKLKNLDAECGASAVPAPGGLGDGLAPSGAWPQRVPLLRASGGSSLATVVPVLTHQASSSAPPTSAATRPRGPQTRPHRPTPRGSAWLGGDRVPGRRGGPGVGVGNGSRPLLSPPLGGSGAAPPPPLCSDGQSAGSLTK